jgi:hypothetical protein
MILFYFLFFRKQTMWPNFILFKTLTMLQYKFLGTLLLTVEILYNNTNHINIIKLYGIENICCKIL